MDPVPLAGVGADDIKISVGVKLCQLIRRQPLPKQLKATSLTVVLQTSTHTLAQGMNTRLPFYQRSAERELAEQASRLAASQAGIEQGFFGGRVKRPC
jgi:hypothetical protein